LPCKISSKSEMMMQNFIQKCVDPECLLRVWTSKNP